MINPIHTIELSLFTEITQDITNFFSQMDGENGHIDLISIDNLREEIYDQPQLFNYTLEQFDSVIKNIFNTKH